MKKVIFTFLITTIGLSAYSQATKALIIDNYYNAKIGTFDPSNATVTESQNVGMVEATQLPRDFIYDAKNGNAIYQDKITGLVFCTIDGGQITSRNFTMFNTVMAPAYMPADNKVACFNVQKEFNGYGNNEDNLFFATIDTRSGITKNIHKFSDVSFDNASAPFYGKVFVKGGFNQLGQTQKEVAISKPLYIAEQGLYIVLLKDVTGTNRLYKIKVNSPNATVASNRCDYNLIDMTYMGNDNIKALYFEKTATQYELKVGDFNLLNNQMSNIAVIKSFSQTIQNGLPVIVNNGSIKFNADQSQLYVSQLEGGKTNIYSLDLATNQNTGNMQQFTGNVQFDFGFSESSYKPLTFANVYKLYPNPTAGEVYFMNQTGVIPNSITVYNNLGQVVRSIRVDEAVSEIKIDLSDMRQGVYSVRADMSGEDFIGKVVVTK